MNKSKTQKNGGVYSKVKKVLHLYNTRLHNLKDAFLSLSKEMFKSSTFSQYVFTDVASYYFTLYGEVLQSEAFELVISGSNTVAKVNNQIIGRLNSMDELEILNCLLVIAASQMHIRTLLYYFKEHFNHSIHNLLLDTLENTVNFTIDVLNKFNSLK